MRRHVLVLSDEAKGLAGPVLRVARVGLSERWVDAVLEAPVGRVVGKKDCWSSLAG